MIARLTGKILDFYDHGLTLDVQGVGYEVFCATRSLSALQGHQESISLFIYTHYKTDGVNLFGFLTKNERELFLSLIKVDSVGPKSALNILSAAPWEELVELIEEGDVSSLSKLPKISKKTAEHVVVKLKGKLSELLLQPVESVTETGASVGATSGATSSGSKKFSSLHKMRSEAQSALVHLGFKSHDVERVLQDMESDVFSTDLESVIRSALNDLSGNSL
jgi:Holliday junction DNA helicase RuvA